MYGHAHAMACMWRTENTFVESVLFFHFDTGSEDKTLVIKLSCKHFYCWSVSPVPGMVSSHFGVH